MLTLTQPGVPALPAIGVQGSGAYNFCSDAVPHGQQCVPATHVQSVPAAAGVTRISRSLADRCTLHGTAWDFSWHVQSCPAQQALRASLYAGAAAPAH